MQIGVFGSHSNTSLKSKEIAYRIGELIAGGEDILITGASAGISDLAARGAQGKGGVVIEISPKDTKGSKTDAICHHDNAIIVLTGMPYKMRNVISVLSCDICIFISGNYGTLNEFTIAMDNGKPCIVVSNTGGISNILHDILSNCKSSSEVHFVNSAEEAYEKAVSMIKGTSYD